LGKQSTASDHPDLVHNVLPMTRSRKAMDRRSVDMFASHAVRCLLISFILSIDQLVASL